MRQGKGVSAAPSTPSGDKNTPKTPRTTGGRKRAAPSTGKSTANKKSKVAVVKSENIYEIDDDSENECPPLNITPSKSLVNEDNMRAYEQRMADGASRVPPLDLAPTQAASPEDDDDDDDVKIVTPADVAHSFEPAQSFSTGNGYPDDFLSSTQGQSNKSYEDYDLEF